jgi:circadian clock protein KaiC
MNEKLEALVDAGQVTVVPVRSLDLSIDEMLHALLVTIDKHKATRLVLDSLTGFEMALAPEDREDFNEALYRLAAVLNARGVTVLMTSEMEDRFQDLRFSPYGSAVLVDVIIMQRYIEVQSELRTLISVVKVRGSKHSRQLRSFEITDEGIVIGSTAAPYDGVVHGNPQPLV